MLLLVMDAKLDELRGLARNIIVLPCEERFQPGIHMLAIGSDLCVTRPR